MAPEDLIRCFIEHLSRMQFDKAREFAENERVRTDWNGFSSLDDRHWPALMAVLAQLANLESGYFSISYFPQKFFRKENNLRELYVQMRSELSRIAAVDLPFSTDRIDPDLGAILPTIPTLASQFARFVSIRASLVEFYTLLPAKEWRAFDEDCFQSLGAMDLGHKLAEPQIFTLCRNEVKVLTKLHAAQRALQECNAIDALLRLKASHELLDDWFCSLEANPAAKPSGPSFFLAFTNSRRRSPIARLGLLQFLLQFHNAMVAKFSLYFHDTLLPFMRHGESKQNLNTPGSLLHLFHTFARKHMAHTICLLLNRIDQDTPFQGFGYHIPSTSSTGDGNSARSSANANEGQDSPSSQSAKSAQIGGIAARKDFQSGISDKYPALLFIPSERRSDHSHYATICSFVQEGCQLSMTNSTTMGAGGGALSTSSASNLAMGDGSAGKVLYSFDRHKEQTFFTACVECNIHLVVTFDRRVPQKDAQTQQFFNEALGAMRCAKLFQELKFMGK